MRTVGRTLVLLLLAAAVAAPLGACGANAQVRPEVVATWPAEGQVLPAGVSVVHVTYDGPVYLLNPGAIAATGDGIGIPVRLLQRDDDPTGIFVLPGPGTAFPVDAVIQVFVLPGAVANEDDHYALENFVLTFQTGPAADVWVGRPGVATPLDRATFAAGTDVPTPAGQDAVALLRADVGTTERVWAQLEDGDGSGAALAWFAPGDAAMTAIPLTTSGGDLVATTSLLLLDPDERHIVAAFRDVSAGRVRVVRVDMDTATEVDGLLLSPASDAATAPYGLALDDDRRILLVACEGPSGPVLAQVDLATFTEIDRDPGTAGTGAEPLPVGAGPTTYARDNAAVADRGGAGAALVAVDTFAIQSSPHGVFGTHSYQVINRDRTMRLAGLDGYAAGEGLIVRALLTSFSVPTAVAISDDVGGGPTGATSVTGLAPSPDEDTFLVSMDTDVIARFTWDGLMLTQVDLDEVTDGIQGVDVSTDAPGIHVIGSEVGALAPLAP
ncbi:MAG: hypothetical protein AB7T63_09910 [Planctomycetota bacterium]